MSACHDPRTLALVMLVAGLLPASAVAQTRYQLTADTLRYREITNQDAVMTLPQGPMALQMKHDAVLAIHGVGPDSAQAFYEALSVEMSSPAMSMSMKPNTAAMLRKPFALRLTPRGEVVTREAPPVPAEIRSVSDLSRQFTDFLITLPAGALTIGTTWADTVERANPESPNTAFESRIIRRYRVARDTVVAGESVAVIAVEQAIEMNIETGSQPERRVLTQVSGTDTGEALFAHRGVLLGRTRQGELRGTVTMNGGAAPVSVPHTISYRSTLELAR